MRRLSAAAQELVLQLATRPDGVTSREACVALKNNGYPRPGRGTYMIEAVKMFLSEKCVPLLSKDGREVRRKRAVVHKKEV